MKGVGRIYQQTFVDTYSRVAMVKLYTEKTSITAADMLNDKVLPYFHEQEIPLLRVLTDRGTEYCGKVDSHAFQLYLAVENLDHSKTKARSPQTNGICERFHRTMKNEFYDIAFRKKLYHSLDELQADVDSWLQSYNELRPHSGRFCYGKTPIQTFKDALHIAKEKSIENKFEIPINRPREDEIPSIEGVSSVRGTAPQIDNYLEHDYNMARTKELEL